jgi:hypothetical protein
MPFDPPGFELHVDTGHDKIVDGSDNPGDPDLIAHFAMTRARDIALGGPPPTEILAPVERSRLVRAPDRELAWAVQRACGDTSC